MKKGCKTYKRNPKYSYTSTKNFLIAKGLIDKFLNIIDYRNFKKEVVELTDLAKEKHGVDEGLLFGERTISSADTSFYQAVANKTAFNKIDRVRKKAEPKQDVKAKDDVRADIQRKKTGNWKTDDEGNVVPYYQKPSELPTEAVIATEKTIRDIAARMAARIGVDYRIVSDFSERFKGKLDKNKYTGKDEAVINLAYATLDTPIHEILGHPIIRAIKNGKPVLDRYKNAKVEKSSLGWGVIGDNNQIFDQFTTKEGAEFYLKYQQVDTSKNTRTLYQNLLKELEYGKGKEVLDRIKRDYQYKDSSNSAGKSITKYFRVYDLESLAEAKDVGAIFNRTTADGEAIWSKQVFVPGVTEEQSNSYKESIKSYENQLEEFSKGNFSNVHTTYMILKYNAEKNKFELYSSYNPKGDIFEGSILHTFSVEKTIDIIKHEIKESKKYILNQVRYSLEEQQEEALVELLGMMTADKLDAVKDGKLISLLKRLLKEIKAFMRALLKQRDVEIDKLPDNMTLGDLSDLLAYSNSKLILPGYEVVYTTPDNEKFKTYAEADNHISNLASGVEEVDLSNVETATSPYINTNNPFVDKIIKNIEYDSTNTTGAFGPEYRPDMTITYADGTTQFIDDSMFDPDIMSEPEADYYKKIFKLGLEGTSNFAYRNKQYEQAKEVIEEWKKINDINYDPEEVYSRGQEFVSVMGAYSIFDLNLMLQNLLYHIEDVEKAGGEFVISAFTKPVGKELHHLEGGGGRVKYKIYPKSQDVKWASDSDVYSGSVWNAAKLISPEGKRSELLGVSYTKAPSIGNIGSVQPNLAHVIDKINHAHNELGIALTGNNFRIEYDKDVPWETKKIVDAVNSILDHKYGKLEKPEITKEEKIVKIEASTPKEYRSGYLSYDSDIGGGFFFHNNVDDYMGTKLNPDMVKKILKDMDPLSDVRFNYHYNGILSQTYSVDDVSKTISYYKATPINIQDSIEKRVTGKKPAVRISDLKEDLYAVQQRVLGTVEDTDGRGNYGYNIGNTRYVSMEDGSYAKQIMKDGKLDMASWVAISQDEYDNNKPHNTNKKKYTSQDLVNKKVVKLKDIAKKYHRSLIRTEVKPINPSNFMNAQELSMFHDELPFQKVPSENQDLLLHLSKELNDKFGFNNPGSMASPTIKDLINQMPIITKANIDQQKLEC